MAYDATTAAHEIKLIHIGRQALGMDDGTYRLMLANLCGKTSSKTLSRDERQRVLQHMKQCGFEVKPKAGASKAEGGPRAAQLGKLRAMWYRLAEAGHVETPADRDACNAAIEAWAKRQLNTEPLRPVLESMRFVTGPQMAQLIEGLKRWLQRVGLDTQP